jgi:regulator of sigma E protease
VDLVYFVVLVGVLIFVHELGHFAWAKIFGVKVLKFSLGFGPRLLGFRYGETEYVLSALPVGGYVKMLGESPNERVAPADEERAFHNLPLLKRLVIVIAGPVMNLLFPIALFFVVFMADDTVAPPIVGTVFPDRPAEGQLLPGDRIVTVAGEEVSSFDEVTEIVGEHPGEPLAFVVDRDGERLTRTVTPTLTRVPREPRALGLYDELGRVGIGPTHPTPVIGVTSATSPAGAADLRTFDVIVSIGGEPVERWIDLEKSLTKNRGSLVQVAYLRPNRVEDALGGLVELDVYQPHVATLIPAGGDAPGPERAGIELADLYVRVIEGTPAHRIGLITGDRLVELDGEPIRSFGTFQEDLRAGRDQEHVLTWRRGSRLMTQPFRMRRERRIDEAGEAQDHYVFGVTNWVPVRYEPPVAEDNHVLRSLGRAIDETWRLVEATVVSVVRLVQGRLSVKSIGGPLTVFEVAGQAARESTPDYLRVMGFISVNLGLINLLPIPILDGGHLAMFLFEAVTRRRISIRIKQVASVLGLVVLVALMVLAFTNDIERQWPSISEWLEQTG